MLFPHVKYVQWKTAHLVPLHKHLAQFTKNHSTYLKIILLYAMKLFQRWTIICSHLVFPLGWSCNPVSLLRRYSRFLETEPQCVLCFYTFYNKTMSNWLLLCSCVYLCAHHISDLQSREEGGWNLSAPQTPAGENHLDEHVFLDIKFWRQLRPSLSLHHCLPLPLHHTLLVFFPFPLSWHVPAPLWKGLFNSTRTKSSSRVCVVSHNSSVDYFYLLYL